LILAIALVSNMLAYLLTEVYALPIKRKPFTCYGCLSFWLTLVFGSVLAFFVCQPYGYAASLVFGLLNYQYVKSKYNITP
jgi:hypothetical protein